MKQSSVSIKWMLLGVSGLLGLIITLMAGIALNRLHTLNDRLNHVVDVPVEKMLLAERLKQDLLSVTRAEKNLILAPTQEAMDEHARLIDATLDGMETKLDALRRLTDTQGRQSLDDFAQIWARWRDNYGEVETLARSHTDATTDARAFAQAVEVGWPLAQASEAALDTLIAKNQDDLARQRARSAQRYRQAYSGVLVAGIAAIVLGIGGSYWLGRRISRNLGLLTDYARQVGRSDDLTLPVPRLEDQELAHLSGAFEQMRQSLRRQTMQLSAVNQRLATQNQEMEQFVYTVSHDLRSPLVTCKGFIALLKEDIADGDEDSVLDSVQRIDAATDQMVAIIDDLLEFSRIGRTGRPRERVDVKALVEALADRLDESIEAAGAKLQVLPNLPVVLADPVALERTFENLITNALKYACDGSDPRITVGAETEKGEVQLYVRDNGPGIDPQYHDRIFGLFQRLDNRREGTGVGLASVAKIMRVHQGRAWVESAPEAGATFWLALPQGREPDDREGSSYDRYAHAFPAG